MPGFSSTHSDRSVMVGLVINDQKIAWAECFFSSAESDQESQLKEVIYILQEDIIPSLMGQPLTNITALMEHIDQIKREVTVARPMTAETPPPKRSRRDLFTSLVNPEEEIREMVERPLPPKLRNGISQALFSASAIIKNNPIVETVAQLYGLMPAQSPLPVHLFFDELPNPTDPALALIPAASYGLTIGDDDPVKELGSSGIRFQNRVRQLKNRAARYIGDSDAPDRQEKGFLFDLKGGYGVLYKQKTGPILGALNGLEQVIKPYALRLVDPVILEDKQSQFEIMKSLQSFLRMRKMNTKLLSRAGINTAEDIHNLADNECCSGILLDMSQLGTLHQTIQLALTARERGLEVILAGVKGKAAVHTALALNPTLLAVGVGEVAAVLNEINRTLAWREFTK